MNKNQVSENFERIIINGPCFVKSSEQLSNRIVKITPAQFSDNSERLFTCHYEKTVAQGSKMCVKVAQLSASKEGHSRLANSTNPALSLDNLHMVNLNFDLHIQISDELVGLFLINASMFLAVVNRKGSSIFSVYKMPEKRPLFQISTEKCALNFSFDNSTRVLAMTTDTQIEPWKISLWRFSEDYKSRQKLIPVDLKRLFLVEGNFVFCLQIMSNFLWVYHNSVLRKFDYVKQKLISSVQMKENIFKLLCVPEGTSLLAITDCKFALPINTESAEISVTKIALSEHFSYHLFSICNQKVFLQADRSNLQLIQIVTTAMPHESTTSRPSIETSQQDVRNEPEKRHHWINYIFWMYAKFPFKDILSLHQPNSNFWFSSFAMDATAILKIPEQI